MTTPDITNHQRLHAPEIMRSPTGVVTLRVYGNAALRDDACLNLGDAPWKAGNVRRGSIFDTYTLSPVDGSYVKAAAAARAWFATFTAEAQMEKAA